MIFEPDGTRRSLDFVPNTDEEIAGARRYVEATTEDGATKLMILQMLGMEPYERTITTNNHGRTTVVKVMSA